MRPWYPCRPSWHTLSIFRWALGRDPRPIPSWEGRRMQTPRRTWRTDSCRSLSAAGDVLAHVAAAIPAIGSKVSLSETSCSCFAARNGSRFSPCQRRDNSFVGSTTIRYIGDDPSWSRVDPILGYANRRSHESSERVASTVIIFFCTGSKSRRHSESALGERCTRAGTSTLKCEVEVTTERSDVHADDRGWRELMSIRSLKRRTRRRRAQARVRPHGHVSGAFQT